MGRIRANKQVVSLFEGLTLSSTRLQKKTKAQARGTAYKPLFSFSEFTNCVEKPYKSLESLLQGTGFDADAKAIVQATRQMISDLSAAKESRKKSRYSR